MRATTLLVAAVAALLAAGEAAALLPAREAVGCLSAVLDEGAELLAVTPRVAAVLPWEREENARREAGNIEGAWAWLVGTVRADWQGRASACGRCTPYPAVDPGCVSAAERELREEIRRTYRPEYWSRVESSLGRLVAAWWTGPRPGMGAVLVAPVARVRPDLRAVLPEPYFRQMPRARAEVPDPMAEPHPGDPAQEELKERRLAGVLAGVEDYRRVGFVTFMRVSGTVLTVPFTADVVVTCLVCTPWPFCGPVTQVFPVTTVQTLERALVTWPAVAEGYGIPGVVGVPSVRVPRSR